MNRDPASIIDICDACHSIRDFIEGMSEVAFRKDRKTQSAVIHQLLIIGEAVKRLSESFRSTHSAIPWNEISRMRDRMIHHYEGVNLHLVWEAASKDAPALAKFLDPFVPKPGAEEPGKA